MAGIFTAAYSFVAAVIGAGFASGQEVLTFFSVFGKWGILGIFTASAALGGFAYFVMSACMEINTDDYGNMLSRFFCKTEKRISETVAFIFLVCSCAVMTACFGETAYLLFGADKTAAALVFSAVCSFLSALGPGKALKLNGALGAVLAAGITASAIYMLRYREHQTFAPQISAVVSGAGYSGYNLIGAGVILAKLSRLAKTKSGAAAAAAISSAAFFIMLTLMFLLLGIYRKYIDLGEIPMLTLAMRENKFIAYFYGIMLLLAVVTTAVSSSVGAAEFTERFGLSRTVSAFAVGAAGFFVSGAGFSAVINTAYRICGYAGIILTIYMIIKYKKYKKDRKLKQIEENVR